MGSSAKGSLNFWWLTIIFPFELVTTLGFQYLSFLKTSISYNWLYIYNVGDIYIYIISNHITILCLVYSNYTHGGWLTSSFSNPCETCATYLSVYKKRGTPESTAELSFSKLLFGAKPHFQVHGFIVDECWWHPTDPHQFLLFGRINHLVDVTFLSGSC